MKQHFPTTCALCRDQISS